MILLKFKNIQIKFKMIKIFLKIKNKKWYLIYHQAFWLLASKISRILVRQIQKELMNSIIIWKELQSEMSTLKVKILIDKKILEDCS